ncbi:MAG: alpha/beta hydrolase [Anaerolineae bacterium]
MKSKIMLSVVALALLLASCGQPTATPTEPVVEPTATTAPAATTAPPTETPIPSPTPEPTSATGAFLQVPCPMQLPAGQVQGNSVDCGYLSVPEDRADPDTRTIRLAVAIFHPPGGATHSDPIIYLTGGPGGSALEYLFLTFDIVFAPVLAQGRDLIFLDQRGVGFSQPALDCPGVSELGLELLDMEVDGKLVTEDEANELYLEAVQACEQDLSAIADLSDYNTPTNAADVEDLRKALGYDQANLWGTSYGTRLALDVMRDYPDGLRSVVLDAVYPPDVDLYMALPANTVRAFDALFESCAADAACNAAFPDLETVFFETVDRLDQTPAEFEITNALTRESYDVLMYGSDLVAILFSFLYHTDVIPSLPQIIYDAADGDFDLISLIQGSLMAQRDVVSLGMQISVQCNEEYPFSLFEEYEELLAGYPRLIRFLNNALVGKPFFYTCAEWDSGEADPIENEPVTSDIPTLLMTGQFDPITPPAWAYRAADTLSNSTVLEFPGVGHGASTVAGCPRDTMIAFFDDPTTLLDASCMAEMEAEFVVPSGEATPVEMEPFTNESMGITGLAPVGWTEAAPGVYTRANSALDVTTLIEQAAPGTASDLLAGLLARMGAEDAQVGMEEYEADGLSWALFSLEVQTVAVDIALTESGDQVLLILLQSTPDEREALVESVYMPAIDALKPIE